MIHPTDEARWREFESNAHLPEVQELIRQEIQSGTIRVRPKPRGGIQIVPVGMPESEEPIEEEPPACPIARRDEPIQESGFQGSPRTALTRLRCQ
jgi:hypothetical protein